jgi:hypothetical protein
MVMLKETRRDPSFAPFLILLLLVLAYNSLYLHDVFYLTRLEISQTGITYCWGGRHTISAPWDRVKGIRTRRLLGITIWEELQVEAPSVKRTWWFPLVLPFLLKPPRIPLGPRIWEREEDLRERIRQRAPAAFPAA